VLYFDHNATSPLCAAAREAWLQATESAIGNPSSQHRIGTRAERALEGARESLAAHLGCAPHEIVWTSGATEAVNTAVHHFAGAGGGGEAWLSAIEHPCLQESVGRWFPARYRHMPVLPDGRLDLEWLREGLRNERPAFVAVMAANNETGVLQPWLETLMLCREAGVPFLCDAAQWIGKLPGEELGACDFVAGCAHKFGGPQEEGRRAGTENVGGALALVAALEARAQPAGERLRWRGEFIDRLLAIIPGARVLGVESERLWNTVSVLLPSPDCRVRWVVKLDKAGVAASTGSACASGKEKPSHVLAAMGLTDEEAGRVVRFSSGWETTETEWQELLAIIERIHAELGTMALSTR
jgi:cysteine desulfurase